MVRNPTPGQLDKYDVDQRIIRTLADFESRTILFSVIRKTKSAKDIVRDTQIPQSSVYKKLERLEGLSLIKIEKRAFSEHGYVTKFYKSRIRGAHINIKKIKPTLTLFEN